MSSDKFLHRLVLPSVRLSDAGQYTAVAGASMSQGHLTVEGRDVKISEPADRNVAVSSCTLEFTGQHSEGLILTEMSQMFLEGWSSDQVSGLQVQVRRHSETLFCFCRLLRSSERPLSLR